MANNIYDTQGNSRASATKQQLSAVSHDDEAIRGIATNNPPSQESFGVNPGAQAEMDRLSMQHNGPMGYNKNAKADSDGSMITLNDESAGPAASSKAYGNESGSLYKDKTSANSAIPQEAESDDKKQIGGSRRKRARIIAGTSLAGLVLAGVTSLGISTVSSPLKIVHFGQVLQGHFKSQEETADGRVSKAIRYVRFRNSGVVEKTNLGYLANKYADKIEANQRAAGWESSYNQNFGFIDGYYLDPTKFANTPLSNLQGKPSAEIIEHFKKTYNVTVVDQNGRLFIDAKSLGPIEARRLIRLSLAQTGLNGKAGPIKAHFMAQRARVSLHPLKAADRALLRAVDQKIANYQERKAAKVEISNKQRAAYIMDGATPAPVSATSATDKDGKPIGDAKSAEDGAKASSADGAKANADLKEGKPGSYSRFVGSTSGKIAIGGAGAVGALCLVKAIMDSADEAETLKVIGPLIRMGMEIISVGGQIMYGTADNKEISVEQIGLISDKTEAFSKEVGMNSDGTVKTQEVGPFMDARSIQAEVGDQQSGPDIGQEAKVSGVNPVKKFIDSLPLGPACSTAGTIILTAISFLGGPVSAAVITGLMLAWGDEIINAAVKWITGTPVNPLARGADLGNFANYGARYAANDAAISSGGAEIANSTTTAYTESERQEEKQEFARQSLAYKLFDPYDRNSMVSHIIDGQSSNPGQNFASLTSSFMNIGKTLASLPHQLLVSDASAARPYNYGFPKFGFTQQEADNPAFAVPQENTEIVLTQILPGSKGDEYIARAETCFGVKVAKDGTTSVKKEITSYKKIQGKGCNNAELDWQRVRFFILDEHVAMSLACYLGDTQKCADLGVGQTGSTSLINSPNPNYANRTPEQNSLTNIMGSWYSVFQKTNTQGAL